MAFEKTEATATPPKVEEADEKPKVTSAADGEKAQEQVKPRADSKPRKDKSARRKPGPKSLESKLTESVKSVGFMLIGVGQVHDGIILYTRGDQLSHAWAQAAEVNPQVEKFLKRLVEGGVWGGVIASSAAIALPIAQNHGIATGVPNPFTLSQEEVASLPDELQTIVALHMAAREETAAASANGGPGVAS